MGVMSEWVRPVEAPVLRRLLVVSPHFDDAVLSVGALLAQHPGTTVITVMGGQPPREAYDHVSEWDALGGFGDGDDVVAARRIEDRTALESLGAQQQWLAFVDNQYDAPAGTERPAADEVAAALEAALLAAEPSAVMVPLGLANPDHVLTHDACRLVIERRPDAWPWLGYAEAGYLHIPGLLAWRMGQLMASGLWPTPAPLAVGDGQVAAKRRALAAYTSQLPALAADWSYDVTTHPDVPESYWRLAPPPPGWGALAG